MRAALKGTVLNMLPIFFKGIVHPNILILSLFTQSCCTKPVLIIILVLNTKEDILKNVGNQTVAGLLTLIVGNKKYGSH